MERALSDYLTHAPIFVRRMDGEITLWTTGAAELYGYADAQALGRSSHDLLKTKFPSPLPDINAELREKGSWQGIVRHTRSDGSELWTESVWRLRPGGVEDERQVVEMNTDVTAREVLSREMNHRVRNNLAVIQGVARLTFRDVDPAAAKTFEGRLIAVARAHDLLMRTNWTSTDLKGLLLETFETFGAAHRADVQGPPVELHANSVLSYALAFHELGANAIKHGALSAGDGHVEARWSLEGQHIHFTWREIGGPAVGQPRNRGLGLDLIERAISSELGTSVRLLFEPEGLVCEFGGLAQKQPQLPGQWPLA